MSTKKLSNSSPAPKVTPGEGELSICRRLAEVRRSFAGERAQSRFARQLGLTPSTYANYEKTRVPPPDLLVKVHRLTGEDLYWLLTGERRAAGAAAVGSTPHGAILERVARLLEDRPSNIPALVAFLDLLHEKTLLEQSRKLATDAARPAISALPAGWAQFGKWIPILGRAAAGRARFWEELSAASGDASADLPGPSAIDEMIHRAAQLSDGASKLAVLDLPPEPATGARGGKRTRPLNKLRVRLVQLSEPITDFQLTEFLEAPELADRYRPLFGLRLDGDSMAPMFPHGAIVLCSPSEPARPGGPAVVRLAGQIGLTCKLYRPRESMVRLVPANDKYPAQEFPARQLEWALAVLGTVRVG